MILYQSHSLLKGQCNLIWFHSHSWGKMSFLNSVDTLWSPKKGEMTCRIHIYLDWTILTNHLQILSGLIAAAVAAEMQGVYCVAHEISRNIQIFSKFQPLCLLLNTHLQTCYLCVYYHLINETCSLARYFISLLLIIATAWNLVAVCTKTMVFITIAFSKHTEKIKSFEYRREK